MLLFLSMAPASPSFSAFTATGLLDGTKFHGRTNPQLGAGIPPPDDFDPPSTREHHKGWHPMHSHLLQKRFAIDVSMAALSDCLPCSNVLLQYATGRHRSLKSTHFTPYPKQLGLLLAQ